ncbi:MAG: magnesium-translocating P-type ATPase [Nitrospirae bacterium]|nr:magnesium-translocating P-type ATPase [Nitrospirota bacterium]MDA8340556.1 magnesium-translocating P-type ATPase [Nitrospiraceae bacterium]
MKVPDKYWETEIDELLQQLGTSISGLSETEAEKRISVFGHNIFKKKKKKTRLSLFFDQFKSPIILILIFASIVSAILRDFTDTAIILAIIIVSGFLSFIQEYSATNAVEKLLQTVKTKATLFRAGKKKEVFIDEIVPGDVVLLSAGDIIPADGVILEAKDFFVNEAILTGETFPVEKALGNNRVFMGTNVESGIATVVVVKTGSNTEIGKIADRLILRSPETDFEKGVRRFGYLLMEVTLILILIVFAVNVYFHHPVIEALLFSLALAVGLTPQLLPAIISVNLSKGSQSMSKKGVIVKRPASIENFGTMDILCTDKTGTLTEGKVYLHEYLDIKQNKDKKIIFYAFLNSFYQTGLKNPIDEAIVSFEKQDISGYEKVDEIPYDFQRRRLSIVVKERGNEDILISKGALKSILDVCRYIEIEGKEHEMNSYLGDINRLYHEWSMKGLRILGIAYKKVEEKKVYSKADESEMTLLGFLLFLDPPKGDAKQIVSELYKLGVDLKIITGDNRFISRYTAESVGFTIKNLVTGEELDSMSDEAILHAVENANIFAEVDPNQKEKIILSLKKLGHVVGFMGDGINDATAIHASDVGISVNTAVDVAKEAADIVLLEKELKILKDGVVEGRKTFANTLKYVFMATSANFGNMFSVAGASLFLPFLPMLPTQILLTNFLTDFPEMTIATDKVDKELVERPRKWDIKFIKRFMIFFGLMSSVFDYITFGVLLFILKADPVLFRTGWFIESVLSASFVVLVIRTRKPFYGSRPSKYVSFTTLLIAAVTLAVPYLPFSGLLGFQPISKGFLLALTIILISYIILAEVGKRIFYKKYADGIK